MALRVPVDNSLAGTILRSGEPMVFDNVQQDPRHFDGVDKKIAFESRSMLGVPLLMRDRGIGVLEAVNKTDNSPFSEEDGQVMMTLAAQAAVAIENARLVTALQKAYEQLNRVDQIKSDFIAIASHELRTPLGLILGYAAMLKEDVQNPETTEQLDVVMNSALRLRDLIDDMVNVQHIEEGKAKLVLTEFVLQDVIQQVVQAVSELYTTKEQEMLISLPPHAAADPGRSRKDYARVEQLADQRDQIHRSARAHHDLGRAPERRHSGAHRRHRHRHSGARGRAHFRSLLSSGAASDAPAWRAGTGLGHRQGHGGIARREDLGGECRGPGQPLLVQCADGRAIDHTIRQSKSGMI